MYNGVPFWSGVISSGLAQVDDTIALSRGQLDTKNYAIHTTSNVTCGIGIMAGLEYGAIIGSVILPGIGTIVGSILLGIAGSRIGYSVGYKTGELLFDHCVKKDYRIGYESKLIASENHQNS